MIDRTAGPEEAPDYREVTIGELLDTIRTLSTAINRARSDEATRASPNAPLLLRAEDAAKLLGIGRTKVFQMANRGQLPAIRLGHALRIPRDALQAWIAEQTEAPQRRDEEGLPGWLHAEASRARGARR